MTCAAQYLRCNNGKCFGCCCNASLIGDKGKQPLISGIAVSSYTIGHCRERSTLGPVVVYPGPCSGLP